MNPDTWFSKAWHGSGSREKSTGSLALNITLDHNKEEKMLTT